MAAIVDQFKAFIADNANKARIAVGGVLAVIFAIIFLIMAISAIVSSYRPLFIQEYAPGNQVADHVLPRFAFCPGRRDNVTADHHHDHFVPGVISSITCQFIVITRDKDGQPQRTVTDIDVQPSVHRIFFIDHNCFDANIDKAKAPLLKTNEFSDYLFCRAKADTNVRFQAFNHERPDGKPGQPSPTPSSWHWIKYRSISEVEFTRVDFRGSSFSWYRILKNEAAVDYSRRDMDAETDAFFHYNVFADEVFVRYTSWTAASFFIWVSVIALIFLALFSCCSKILGVLLSSKRAAYADLSTDSNTGGYEATQ